MIENASILRYDARSGSNAAGEDLFTTGSTVAGGGVRCFADEIGNNQRYTLGSSIKDASKVVYLPKANWTAKGFTTAPEVGGRMLVAVDGESAVGELGFILVAKDRVMSGMEHWELFLKK